MTGRVLAHRGGFWGLARQAWRYGLVGVLSNVAGWCVFLLITALGVHYAVAASLLYALGALIGFFGNKVWAFEHQGSSVHAGVKYVLAHLCGYGLNMLILYWGVVRWGWSHAWAQAVGIAGVALFLFVVFRWFVFPAGGNEQGSVQ